MDNVIALLKDEMDAVEEQIKKNLTSNVQLVSKVGEYILSSGGKRIRPMLLLLSARLCEYRGERHVELASVVEFLHTATLLHDDVVDSAAAVTVQQILSGVTRLRCWLVIFCLPSPFR